MAEIIRFSGSVNLLKSEAQRNQLILATDSPRAGEAEAPGQPQQRLDSDLPESCGPPTEAEPRVQVFTNTQAAVLFGCEPLSQGRRNARSADTQTVIPVINETIAHDAVTEKGKIPTDGRMMRDMYCTVSMELNKRNTPTILPKSSRSSRLTRHSARL